MARWNGSHDVIYWELAAHEDLGAYEVRLWKARVVLGKADNLVPHIDALIYHACEEAVGVVIFDVR